MKEQIPTAELWWSWFRSALTDAYKPDALLGKCERRVKERHDLKDYCKEWTAVMSVFLSDMAQDNKFHNKFHQRWEVEGPKKKGFGKIDFAWYRYEHIPDAGDKICNQPSVLIEHEQQRYEEEKKGLKWVAQKLMESNMEKCPPPLRVLVTYRWQRPQATSFDDEELKELVSGGLCRRKRVPFLLVIGSDDRERDENGESFQDEWHGYIWEGRRGWTQLKDHIAAKGVSQKGSETATP